MKRNNVKTYECYWSCQKKYFKKIQNYLNTFSFFFSLLLLVGPFIFAFGSLSKTSLKTFLYQMEAEISLNSASFTKNVIKIEIFRKCYLR